MTINTLLVVQDLIDFASKLCYVTTLAGCGVFTRHPEAVLRITMVLNHVRPEVPRWWLKVGLHDRVFVVLLSDRVGQKGSHDECVYIRMGNNKRVKAC
jgi:hypothetical protein